jgi:aminopeptidase-like protein
MSAAPTISAPADIGQRLYALAAELYPMPRSLTGDGFRRSLKVLQRHVPIELIEIPSGTQVFDWTVPDEWNLRAAWIKDPRGQTIVDVADHALHVLGYSEPIHRRMPLSELRPHLFSLPNHPDWIPYRTSYYQRNWGFCLTDRQLRSLSDGMYEVCIDATLAPGHLTLGELLIPGGSSEEFLISTHCCHPQLANDNCSGMSLATHLAMLLRQRPKLRYSYRFLFIPGTIGSIAWLAKNEANVSRIKHGLVVTCVGDGGDFNYKRSRRGDAPIDRAAAHVLRHCGRGHRINDFSPYGYDERQYCSPGFDLPVGALMRTPNGQYPEYHTSADNLDLISPAALADSLRVYLDVIDVIENDRCWINLQPKCEPQLGKRGLYRATGGEDLATSQLAMLWVLNQSDGRHSLLDIAERSGLKFSTIRAAAEALAQGGLLRIADPTNHG